MNRGPEGLLPSNPIACENIDKVPLGMETNHVVTAEITLGRAFGQSGAASEFFNRLETGLRNLPGVTGVAVSDSLPPIGGGHAQEFFNIHVEGHPPSPKGSGGLVGWGIVTPGYFQMLGIPILEGRGFTASDQNSNTRVIVVSKKLAARLFSGQNAIGQHLQIPASGPWYTVVGISGEVKYLNEFGRVGPADPEYYIPRHENGRLAQSAADSGGTCSGSGTLVRCCSFAAGIALRCQSQGSSSRVRSGDLVAACRSRRLLHSRAAGDA